MSITAEKKDGALTGWFRVEAQKDKMRLRARCRTMDEARKVEAEFKQKLANGDTTGATARVPENGAPVLLSHLVKLAVPALWKGHDKNDLRSEQILLRVSVLVGDVELAKFTTRHIDQLISKLSDEGLSGATINRYLAALHKMVKWACGTGRKYVPEMPEFQWQDEDEGRLRWLTADEEITLVKTLVDFGQAEIADYVVAAIDTGCRRSELLEAQRDQLDVLRNSGAWLRLHETKNGDPRSVPLTDRTKDILQARLPWSFTDKQLRWWWNKAKEAMGLAEDEEFVVHALRHTCATRLVETKVNLRVIQKYMGHRSITTTLKYAHVSDDMLTEAASILSARAADKSLRAPAGGGRERGTRGNQQVATPTEPAGEQVGRPMVALPLPDLGTQPLFPSLTTGGYRLKTTIRLNGREQAGSDSSSDRGGVAERSKAADCKSGTPENPSPTVDDLV